MTLRQQLTGLVAALMFGSAWAEPQLLDQVSVLVNEGVILKSEIDERVQIVKSQARQAGQSLPDDQALRTQVIDRLILESLQLQIAERMGMQISDTQLDQAIGSIAQEQSLSVAQLRQRIQAEGGNYARYREQVRQEITLGQVQRIQVQRRVQISDQEIETLVGLLNEQGLKNAEFHIGHILIELGDDETAARRRADHILSRLQQGADFRQTALVNSSGPKALEGGDWGFMNINAMPTLFAEVVKDGKKGDFIGPFKSSNGFHIVAIFDTRGQDIQEVTEVKARHILLKTSPILNDETAKQLLDNLLAELKLGQSTFAELAQEYSNDPGSASQGGDLGWADPSAYVPEFSEALAVLQPGDLSKPFRSSHGWHIVQLLDRRTTDATDKATQDRAYQLLFRRKFGEQAQAWQDEMRSGAYIEVLEQGRTRS